VTVFGGEGDDTIEAGAGEVTIFGGDGADDVEVTGGTVTIFGGDGDDETTVSGGTAEVTVFGGGGADDTEITDGTVTVFGGSGDDDTTVSGGTAEVTIFGGDGDDDVTLTGGADDVTIFGGDGADDVEVTGTVTIFGGDGDDAVVVDGGDVTVFGGEGDDTIEAGAGDVTIFGGDGADDVEVTGGDVTIFGGEGDDETTVSGGTAEVTIFGGGGADETDVTDGTVTIFGGDGDDDTTVSGGTAEVTIFGGDGDDETTIAGGSGGPADVTVFGGDGDDDVTVTGVVTIFGGDGEDAVFVGAGDVTVFGGDSPDEIDVSGGDVTIFGGDGSDDVDVNGGTVTIFGGTGDDTVDVTGGDVTVFGGTGDDDTTVSGGTAEVTIFGGDGNDETVITDGTVTVYGGDGADETTISGGAAEVTVFGGDGEDTTEVTGEVTIFGGDGLDAVLTGGTGDVTVFGGDGDDSIVAESGDVTIFGGSGDDTTEVDGGAVTVFAGDGDDTVDVTGGDVTIFGGAGDDETTVAGGTSQVTIFGGDGADETSVGDGEVTIFGGDGNDATEVTGGTVTVFGGDGSDETDVEGGAVTVFAGTGDDEMTVRRGSGVVLAGEDGDDTYVISFEGDAISVALRELKAAGAFDSITESTSDGLDTVIFLGLPAGIDIDLGIDCVALDCTTLPALGGQSVSKNLLLDVLVTLFGFVENVTGTPGPDTITGNSSTNYLVAGGGDDSIYGLDGDDTLDGGSGSDLLDGDGGNDTYIEVPGSADEIFDDSGAADTIDFSAAAAAISVDLRLTAGDPQDVHGTGHTVAMFGTLENVIGTAFNDTIIGNDSSNILRGGGGNDQLIALGGDDLLEGGAGDDLLAGDGGNDTYLFAGANLGSDVLDESTAATGDGTDTLDFSQFTQSVTLDLSSTAAQTGSPGNLELTIIDGASLENVVGSSLSDSITGNSAANKIIGGGGADLIDGGAGNDNLVASSAQVVLLDFDSETDALTEHEYTIGLGGEREAILQRLVDDYAEFAVQFETTLAAAEAAAVASGGAFVTLVFNAGPAGGAANALDFRNTDKGGMATINVNPLMDRPGGPAGTSENFIELTAEVAAHELGHLMGLRHGDAQGPIGGGIFALLGAGAFLPDYPGLDGAVDTPQHIMASPDSMNISLCDSVGDLGCDGIDVLVDGPFFGPREQLKLAFADSGHVIGEQSVPHDSLVTAQPLGPLPGVNVPGTPTGFGFGAIAVVGSIGLSGAGTSEDDLYSFEAQAGDILNVEVMSNAISRITDKIDSLVTVLDSSGQPVAFFSGIATNDDEFETQDSIIIDLLMATPGTYYIKVDTFSFTPGTSLFDQFCQDPSSNPACMNTDTGGYELFAWVFSGNAPAAGGDTLIGGAGSDSMTGSSGNDTVYTNPSDGDEFDDGGQGDGDDVNTVTPPIIIAVDNDGPVNEGSSATVTVTATDSGGPAGALQFEFDCNGDSAIAGGDGFEVGPQSNNFTACFFGDDGNFTVNVRVTDAESLSVTGSTTVEMVNVAPEVVLSVLNDTSVNEGTTHTYDFTIGDPGDDTITGVTVSCGTNGTQVGAATFTNSSGSFQCQFADGPASSDVSAGATDSDNANGAAATQAVTVNNVAPTVTLSGDSSASEGQTKTYTYTVNDPGNDPNPTISESCGAGAIYIETAAPYSFDCTFPDGPDSPTVSVTADDGDLFDHLGSASITVVVANVAPTVMLSGDSSVSEGQTKTYTYTVNDPGNDPNPTITESCGAGAIYIETAAPYSFDCTFPDGPDSPTVSVTANDGDLSENVGSASITVVVNNVAPVVTLSGPASTDEGQTKHYTFTAYDPGQDTFTVLVASCGSGAKLNESFNANDGSGAFDCTFPDGPATTSVSVQEKDSDNDASNTATVSVAVANVAPTVAVFGATTGSTGIAVNFTFASFDPSDADQADIRYHIDWDGDSVVDQIEHGDDSIVVAHTYTTAGTYTVRVFARDKDNDSSTVATHVIEVALVSDVIVEGTADSDKIEVRQDATDPNLFHVTIETNGVESSTTQILGPGGHIVVNAYAGNDVIIVTGNVGAVVDGGLGNDAIFTGSGNDTVIDLSGHNVIATDGGNDVITTGSGIDLISTGSGNDTVMAGPGFDVVLGGDGNDRIYGEAGSDVIDGGSGDDDIDGGDAADILIGGDGNDVILGRAGNDDITGSAGHDVLVGGFGADRIVGSSGNDILIAGELTGTHQSTNVATHYNGQSYSFDLLRAIGQAWALAAIQDSDLAAGGNDDDIIDEAISAEKDLLTGASGADWFILNLANDRITDLKLSQGDKLTNSF
jgi:Ca2+-binding RTX toxin-like protein